MPHHLKLLVYSCTTAYCTAIGSSKPDNTCVFPAYDYTKQTNREATTTALSPITSHFSFAHVFLGLTCFACLSPGTCVIAAKHSPCPLLAQDYECTTAARCDWLRSSTVISPLGKRDARYNFLCRFQDADWVASFAYNVRCIIKCIAAVFVALSLTWCPLFLVLGSASFGFAFFPSPPLACGWRRPARKVHPSA